jgi:Transposase DDE domain/Domain of unknown function (DUF4372)
MFSQVLKLFPRIEFERLVRQTGAEYRAKGMSSWTQFVAMLFCQFGGAKSLREVVGGLKSVEGKLDHLGIEAPVRSTLAYANRHRPWELFREVFYALFEKVSAKVVGRRKFRFKNKLLSLDSTTIDLCLSMYDWARFTRTKGAVKLHLVLDHDGYLPSFAVITDGKVSDVEIARQLDFAPGTIVVEDRGYTDYALYARWIDNDVYFVSRLRANAKFEVVQEREVRPGGLVLKDQIIRLTDRHTRKKCQHPLRRVEALNKETGEILVFVTNHYQLAAGTIAAIYKDRWQIELFFKALKQNLKIKTFVGTSANAVKTQIWTALIAMLLFRYLQLCSRFGWSLANLVALLRMNLFTHRDLMAWLDEPYALPPDPQDDPQASLGFC